MPRRGRIARRQVPADAVYHHPFLAKLVNQIMYDGKKGLSEQICYGALDIIQTKTGRNPIEVLDQAIKNIMPVLEVRARRVGGANYQVPIEVRPERRHTLAIRWLVNFARARGGKGMDEKLASEIMDAANGVGGTVKKKEDTHRMAEANKAFAHYRW